MNHNIKKKSLSEIESADLEIVCPITNQYAFPHVMGDGHEQNCRDLLQRIFPDKEIMDMRIVDLAGEKSISNENGIKSIRLDVLFRGESLWANVEMQVEDCGDIPKRSRFYHSSMDMLDLKRGNDYDLLRPHYVIFICAFDLFGLGEAIYPLEKCYRKKDLPLGDESYTIIMNLKCDKSKIPEELKTFYAYANEQKVDENDDFIKRLHSDLVKFSRTNGGTDMSMQGFMTVEKDIEIRTRIKERRAEERGFERGEARGEAIGEARRSAEIARNMLKEGIDNETVSRITGLSKEAILSL